MDGGESIFSLTATKAHDFNQQDERHSDKH
jgi:hypothetical protein